MRKGMSTLVAALLVAACTPRTGVGPSVPGRQAVAPSAGGNGLVANGGSTLTGNDGSTLVSNDSSTGLNPPGASVVSNDGSTLMGVVTAPGVISNDGSTLISQDGGGLISQDGGGIVAQGGGNLAVAGHASYGLASLDERPLAGVTVRVLDAAGNPVMGKSGQPLSTTTDAKGAYHIADALPGHNLVVVVELPGKQGEWRAIAPKNSMSGPRQANVNLAAELASTYILDTWVMSQPDAVTTLDRLTPDAAAATLALTGQALQRAANPLPTTFAANALDAFVAALRQANSDLDAQFQKVAKLLVIGESDLGNGLDARQVALRGVQGLLPDGHGGLLIADQGDHRVWDLAGGKLVTYAGSGQSSGGQAGQGAAQQGFGNVTALVRDADGRVCIIEPGDDDTLLRMSVVDEAGKVASVVKVLPTLPMPETPGRVMVLKLVAPGAAGQALVFGPQGVDTTKDGNDLAPFDAQTRLVAAFPRRVGRDAQGRLYLGVQDANAPARVYRYAPATKTAETLFDATRDALSALDIDGEGNVFTLDGAGHLSIHKPDGSVAAVPAGWPAGVTPNWNGVALGAQDTVYVADGAHVYSDAGGAWQVVAGADASAVASPAPVTLAAGTGLATSGSAIWLADDAAHQLLAVTPSGGFAVAGGTGTLASAGDGGPVKAASFGHLQSLGADDAGNLYVLEAADTKQGARVRKVAPDGTISLLYQADGQAASMAVGRDGTVYLATTPPPGTPGGLDDQDAPLYRVTRISASGKADTVVPLAKGFGGDVVLAVDASNRLAAFTDSQLVLDPGGANQKAITPPDTRMDPEGPVGLLADTPIRTMTFDAAGNLYLARLLGDSGSVVRWDIAGSKDGLVAGSGTAHFGGTGVDDGLGNCPALAFTPSGDLLLLDASHKQIKRLLAKDLAAPLP